MYIEITKGNKKYYIDTKKKFSQEVIEDLGIKDIEDICFKLEFYADYSDYDDGNVEVDYFRENELRATYTSTIEYTLIEALENILDDVEVKEIPKEFYDLVIESEPIYKCEYTLDLFENKE